MLSARQNIFSDGVENLFDGLTENIPNITHKIISCALEMHWTQILNYQKAYRKYWRHSIVQNL